MPWAADNRVSTSPIEGGIEITEAEYQAALEGIMEGKIVSIEGGVFALVDPPAPPQPEPEPPPPDPLRPLTSRQLRLGLVLNGISLSSVEAAIDAIEDPTDREVARIEWEYATTFERSHPLVNQIGVALGLTPEQIDDMWAEAAAL
ncbi:hypothetical protein [Chelatococcus composti]|uniref:Uncharacterized protein n=1 Tax=Chelatococcus composti TaxID=1743235 RepID=A0A841KAG4_9HYPH|nr:hypothetical protein [Chelatococcus composti]MBB6169497.1 hypothetical protein [Chelatococcus composti]MBS7737060.1 hypothetical protein [Chelatococcus composti]GGG48187.1 hypothetical protein GCM10008026_31810 [Chelatococcus composti]